MGHLCACGVDVSIGVQAAGDVVGVAAHLLHDVYLTIGGPRLEVDWHHPEGRPCALALWQLDAGLNISVGPTAVHLGIDTSGVDLAVLLEAVDAQRPILDLGPRLAVG